ncbi:MAG: nucleic-acid-binding protein implicated in transcription termination [Clostridiaceae bacterium BRH_c20a]|nr:MAG: nucleic-acid-binding protein implicated in transcription termination [Clostridiaceae bacterium BRH_c20a]
MCIGCQVMFDKRELLRIVRTPEGEILLDNTGKKSGRGAYICSGMDCFKKVVKTKKLAKALKTAIPEEVYESLKVHFHE